MILLKTFDMTVLVYGPDSIMPPLTLKLTSRNRI